MYSFRIFIMTTLSYTAVRSNLAKTMEKVCEDHTPYIITRSKAEPVVMISLADFEALQETHYLMQSPTNAARIAESIDEIEKIISKKKDK
jgi:antitoxin YefM